jgi:hypothetical protein
MKKLLAIVMAAVLAVSTSLAVSTPAKAFFPWWGIAIAAGVGLATGAAIASSHDYAVGHDATLTAHPYDHVTACQDRYRTYDPARDTYLGRDGHRHQCML